MTAIINSAGLLRFFCTISLIFQFFICQAAAADIVEDRTVRVGIYENEPKVFTSEAGKPAGIFIDIIEFIAKGEGWKIKYVPGTWNEGLERLAKGEIDLMPDVAHTADRGKIYSFHQESVLSSWSQVYGKKGSDIQSILDLANKRIATLQGSIQQEAFARLSEGFDLKITLIPVRDYKSAFAMVANDEADAAICNNFFGLMHIKEYGLKDSGVVFSPTKLLFAAPKNFPKHLLETIDKYLVKMKENSDSVYYASLKHWTSEEVHFKIPLWLQILGYGGTGFLIMSLIGSVILKHQVNMRTQELQKENVERQKAQQQLTDIIEFLPDATFVIDQNKRIIAWNQSCETLTGVKKETLIGKDDYAYAEPFYGEKRPILIDLLDAPAPELESTYAYARRKDYKVYAESFFPNLRAGQGAHLWGVASPLYDQDGRRCGAIESIRDITEQKIIEEALRSSEREYRELVMLANSIIMRWSPEGRIIFLNEFGQQFFGYTADEIAGRPMIGTLVPEKESEGRDLQSLIDEISADPRKFERNINENTRRSGERVWIDWTNKAVFDEQGKVKEILSIGSDITERKQTEEQIRLLNDDLRRHAETLEERVAERTAELAAINDEQRTIFESASTGIVLLRNRVIVRCNRKLEEISGYDPGELIGKSTRIWYPTDEAYTIGGETVYLQMAKGETFRREQQMARKDGSLFWVRLSLRAFDQNDPFKGAVGIIEDITDEYEAAENLRKALEAAQAADRIKSAFLATMSHELRTPLNSIIGFTGIMLQGLTGPLNPEQHKQMTMVQNSSRHLLALINDVLDISKIEAGQLVLACSACDLGASIDKMVKLVSPLAEKKGIELKLDLPDATMTLSTDQRRLEQVVLNLLSNAVKFTEQGEIRISCASERDHFLLTFADTGIGIQQEDIPKLFQPFHQLDTGLARKREGTGLGLSICKKIVDLMGGSIEVQSQYGQGSIFTVRLPRQAGETA